MHAHPGQRLGLALSGGGLRATLFGLGSLWRLNDLGWLPHVHNLTGVSGGALSVAALAVSWKDLEFRDGHATNFEDRVARPLDAFSRQGLTLPFLARALANPLQSANDALADYYAHWLYGDVTLPDLPMAIEGQTPEFMIYTTSLQTGGGIAFSQSRVTSRLLGVLPAPRTRLAQVVAASSAVPPFLSPAVIHTDPARWVGGETALPDLELLRQRLVLADGGVYDNLGMDALLKETDVSLVSDAGAPFRVRTSPTAFWPMQMSRVNSISALQGERLRRSAFLSDLLRRRRRGAYWGVATPVDDFRLRSAMTRDNAGTRAMADVPTARQLPRLATRRQLVNWGYCLADAAIRRYVSPTAPRGDWPYPAYSL